MSAKWGAGFHTSVGGRLDSSAYEQYVGRWSRLFVPALLAAAEVTEGDRVLDVATGPGEAARQALQVVGYLGLVVGSDVSLAMLQTSRGRLPAGPVRTVVTDGQALSFPDTSFDAVLCQLGLMFFPDPARGLAEFRRVLRSGRCAAVCVISSSDRAPMWGFLAETLSHYLPEQRQTLQLSFALSNGDHLTRLFSAAGFRDIRIGRETREGSIESFDAF